MADDDYLESDLDPHFARSFVGYTTAEYDAVLVAVQDPHGFVGKHVLLIDLPQESLNGCSGLVTGVHTLARTYSILLDGVKQEVYAPAEKMIILFHVDPGISKHGGEYDRDDALEKAWLRKRHEPPRRVSYASRKIRLAMALAYRVVGQAWAYEFVMNFHPPPPPPPTSDKRHGAHQQVPRFCLESGALARSLSPHRRD